MKAEQRAMAAVRVCHNARAAGRGAGYPDACKSILSLAALAEAAREIGSWPGYRPTPLTALPGLAAKAGVARLWYKDEGGRFGLGSFKALGGAYAVFRLLVDEVRRRTGAAEVTTADLVGGKYRDVLSAITVTCATDGNHGRSVAWGAQTFGCRCVIYIHARVSEGRRDAILRYGAEVVRTRGNYDDSVRQAAEDAARNGWFVVSDTSYEGYVDVPRTVMQGYAVMVDEALQQLPTGERPTHVFVQGGVGGLAAAVCSYLWESLGPQRPRLVVVEPEKADCLFQSAVNGRPTQVRGELDTLMAGLACGEVSLLAWKILETGADDFMAIPDEDAVECMRLLAAGTGSDPCVVAGESAVAGLAGMLAAARDGVLGLDAESRILVFGSEGDTDPDLYTRLVGCAAAEVRRRNRQPAKLRIDPERLAARLDALAAVGAIEGGGVCRLALSDEDRAGRDLVVGWMHELGLDVTVDGIGNVVAVRNGLEGGPPVMTGSHVDTVSTGGRYDGNLGVLAGLEVVAALNEAGIVTRRALAVAFFTNEEGARFNPDMMGSLVYVGGLSLDEALATVGIDGTSVRQNLDRIGYAGPAPCGQPAVHAYVELHVEQGPVLEAEGVTIGAVESVQGISWTEFTVTGVSNHAGTTPMRMRHDAGFVATAIAQHVRQTARELGGDQLATVGSVRLFPNLVNVIPNRAVFTVDLRNTDEAILREAERRLHAFAAEIADAEGVALSSRSLARFEPVPFDAATIGLVESTARALGHRVRRLPSGAGHDAQMLARVCPAAMIFVPSVGGISHNVREYTTLADLTAGGNVLLQAMLRLAS